MDLVFDFILSSVGYFITTYFVYSIFGRKPKIAYFLLVILFLSTLYPYIMYGSQFETNALILLIVRDVGPVFFAFLVFISITGGLPVIKIKRRPFIKGVSSTIQTKRMNQYTSIIVLVSSLIAGGTAYFIFEDITMYLILFLSVMGFILGILLWINTSKVNHERVILFVGKNKEKSYTFEIPSTSKSVDIKDFFNDERYIVDRIGEATIIKTDKKQEKDYLYWIATGDKIDIQKPLYEIHALPYKDYINEFEKYHIKHIWFSEDNKGYLEKTKEKIMK